MRAQPPEAKPSAWPVRRGMMIVVGACLLLGWQASWLNRQLYTHRQPFFDSLSYNARLHRVISVARQDGLGPALQDACFSTTTVCLPYLVGLAVAPLIEPSRLVGVWIQVAQLLALTLSLFYYLCATRRAGPRLALLLMIPFFCLACLGSDHGGLSDFRMDLGLMLMFGATCIWYLIASDSGRLGHFLLFGLLAGLTMLCRATAPVYLGVSLGPVVLLDWLRSARRARLTVNLLAAGGICLASSLWFYLANFQHLYYYYFVWNTDANAGLSLRESFKHLEFTLDHIGAPLQIWLVIAYLVLITGWLVKPPGTARRNKLRQHVDLRLGWIGVSPLVFLILRGAGLNPFVCMPATLGIVMALVVPLIAISELPRPRVAMAVLAAAGLACVISVTIRAHRAHRPEAINSMAAHRAIIDAMAEDAHARRPRVIRFSTVHLHYINAPSLYNVLLFDMPEVQVRRTTPLIDQVPVVADRTFVLPAAADWNEIPGESDEQKIQHLVDTAAARIDYLVIPEEASMKQIADQVSAVVINRHGLRIRQLLLDSQNWEPITGPIANNSIETVRVYRNVRRAAQVARRREANAR